jgi:hypothetical protein
MRFGVLKFCLRTETFPNVGRVLTWSMLVVLLAFVRPVASNAGLMSVYSCHTPSGRTVGTNGWVSDTEMAGSQALNDCAHFQTGTMFLRLAHVDGQSGPGARWLFTAPEGTQVRAFSASVCMQANGAGNAEINWDNPGPEPLQVMPMAGTPYRLGCTGALPLWSDARNRVERSGLATTHLMAWTACAIWCNLKGETTEFKARLEIASARIDIEDTSVRRAVALGTQT